MPVRLLAIDIDGTLLDSQGKVPDDNVKAIQRAVECGVAVTLVTGRSFPFARPIADVLPKAITLIVSNGALVKALDGTTRRRWLLPRATARIVLERTRSFRAAAAVVFDRADEGHIVAEDMDWDHPNRRGYYARNRHRIRRSDPLEDALTDDPVQIMFNGSVTAMREIHEALGRLAIDDRVEVLVTEYEERDFTLLDVLTKGCTKGTALASLADDLGIAAHEVMAIGDNFNDVEMLEYAGVPVVMGNAVAGIKSRGWHLTAGHDAAGVARAVDTFIPS